MNTENLLKVKAIILEEPLRFNMEIWKSTSHLYAKAKCGTVACIAGWGATLRCMDEDRRLKKASSAAERFLACDAESIAGNFFELGFKEIQNLFFDFNWPDDLRERLVEEMPGSAAYAQVAAEAIDRFIACGGDWDREPAILDEGFGE